MQLLCPWDRSFWVALLLNYESPNFTMVCDVTYRFHVSCILLVALIAWRPASYNCCFCHRYVQLPRRAAHQLVRASVRVHILAHLSQVEPQLRQYAVVVGAAVAGAVHCRRGTFHPLSLPSLPYATPLMLCAHVCNSRSRKLGAAVLGSASVL